MDPDVVFQANLQSKFFGAIVTFKQLSGVDTLVIFKVSFLGETLIAKVALEWFFPRVSSHMQLEISLLTKRF